MDKCIFCGCEIPEVLDRHHILPRSKGGCDIPHNKLTVCANCHRKIHAYGLTPDQKTVSADWVKLEQLPLWAEESTEERKPERFVIAPMWYVTKLAENRAKSASFEARQISFIENNALLLTPGLTDKTETRSKVRPYILRKYEDGHEILIVASSIREARHIDKSLDKLELAEQKGEITPDLEMHAGYLDHNTGQMYIITK